MIGDFIVGVDEVSVIGKLVDEVVAMVRGPEGEDVTITIYRPYENERFDVVITRARVEIPLVHHEMHVLDEGRIGYIHIDGFDGRPSQGQFISALEELMDEGMDGLILDLRNNSGGLLDVVNYITNMLIPEGVITFTENNRGERRYHYSTEGYLGLPLVLLVNGRSASASEVLSGAVRDTGVGTIIGERTFGKGVVNQVFPLSDESAVQLTIQKYFTPNGDTIHGIGVEPDIVIEMDPALSRMIGQLDLEDDVQLQKALEVITEKIR